MKQYSTKAASTETFVPAHKSARLITPKDALYHRESFLVAVLFLYSF